MGKSEEKEKCVQYELNRKTSNKSSIYTAIVGSFEPPSSTSIRNFSIYHADSVHDVEFSSNQMWIEEEKQTRTRAYIHTHKANFVDNKTSEMKFHFQSKFMW